MAVLDIRAQVICSLGRVITGNLADTYAQQSGLIFTRGSVELDGIYRPAVGTKVQFAYAKNGYLARLPRTVRVLSCFADPFRRKTTVQLGCLLTYLESRKPPIENPNSKDENDVPCYVYDRATLPISATYVVQRILTTLGISSATIPLTNVFSVEEFDLSPGFIQVLSDLLVSEGYIGYLDEDEVLRFRSLAVDTGSGPVINSSNIIDIGPIGVGDLPGDAVVVNYSSRRLKPPEDLPADEAARRNWDYEESFGADREVTATYTDEQGEEVTVTDSYRPYNFSATTYDAWERAVERISFEKSSVAEVNNRWATDRYRVFNESIARPAGKMTHTKWTYKLPPAIPNYSTNLDLLGIFWDEGVQGVKAMLSVQGDNGPASECKEEPPDGYEEVLTEKTRTFISEAELAGTLNFDTYTYEEAPNLQNVPGFDTAYTVLESVTTVAFEKDISSGISKQRTESWLCYGKTTTGQQDLATRVNSPPEISSFVTYGNFVDALVFEAKRIVSQGVDLRIRTEREFGLQRRPSQQDRNNTANAKPEVTEQKAEVTWVTGGTESTNYVEFSLPYAPDDKIIWSALGGYSSIPSDAGTKALRFGRIQNRLLLGNRSGVSIQLVPELMPPKPFDPIYLQADGLTGQYRVNACTWSFDSSGIIASGDFLYWGAVGTSP